MAELTAALEVAKPGLSHLTVWKLAGLSGKIRVRVLIIYGAAVSVR